MHPAALPLQELLAACDVIRTRRSGPGGQHRNKVETAVVITHRPSGVQGQASERRSQDLNRQAAVQRLRIRLAIEIRLPAAADDPPSDLWRSRVKRRQLAVSTAHADFPALLAEALDRLAACEWDAGAAAGSLGITASQLVKFLKLAPEAIAKLNQARAARELRPMR
jgi:hypothetical protein